MDVAGGRDTDNQKVILWSCHRGANQRFEVDYNIQRPVYATSGIVPNRPFMIFSRMHGNRVLAYYPQNGFGRGTYPVVIRKPQYDRHELWWFNAKTGKIHLMANKHWCLTVQNNNRGARLVIRANANQHTTQMQAWNYKQNQVHNWSTLANRGLCIDVW